jgi:hypothetical protein
LPCQHNSLVSFHFVPTNSVQFYGQPGIKVSSSVLLISVLFPLDNCFTHFRIVFHEDNKDADRGCALLIGTDGAVRVPACLTLRIACIPVWLQYLPLRAATDHDCYYYYYYYYYYLTLSLLMSYIYGAPSKATKLTSCIYGREILLGILNLEPCISLIYA